MPLRVNQIVDEEGLNQVFKLRYKVYCQEWGFETPCNHSTRTLADSFDECAIHFAALDESRKIVGAVALILDSELGFPVEKYCELTIDPGTIERNKIGEISKLVIHREYRRRAEDKYVYGPDEERRSIGSFDFQQTYPNQKIPFRRADDKYRYKLGARRVNGTYSDRRRRHEVVIDLYRAVYKESKERGLTHWYSIMTKGIVNLLNKFGFSFEAIGDPVDYHGIRTPYLAEIAKMEEDMSTRYPELYEEFTRAI